MKRFTKTFMIAAAICIAGFTANAQENLVKNSDFSGWDSEKNAPTSWIVYDGTATQVDGTCQLVQTKKSKATLLQYVNGITAGKQYTFSFEVKVVTVGSTADAGARQWFRWQRYASSTDKEWLDPTSDDLNKMHGPGGDEAYMQDKVGEWQTFSETITAPEKTTTLGYEFRVYNGATVQFRNCSLVEVGGAAISSTEANTLSVYAADGVVYVPATAGQNIVVTNVAGQVVANVVAESEVAAINNLPANQVLLVKVGNQVAKVIR